MDIEKEIAEIKQKLQEIEKAQKEKPNIRPRVPIGHAEAFIEKFGKTQIIKQLKKGRP